MDISKAYTAAFTKIRNIPVFNEFDHFKPYNGDEIKDCSLHIKGLQINHDIQQEV